MLVEQAYLRDIPHLSYANVCQRWAYTTTLWGRLLKHFKTIQWAKTTSIYLLPHTHKNPALKRGQTLPVQKCVTSVTDRIKDILISIQAVSKCFTYYSSGDIIIHILFTKWWLGIAIMVLLCTTKSINNSKPSIKSVPICFQVKSCIPCRKHQMMCRPIWGQHNSAREATHENKECLFSILITFSGFWLKMLGTVPVKASGWVGFIIWSLAHLEASWPPMVSMNDH